jgi:hypothetical protein
MNQSCSRVFSYLSVIAVGVTQVSVINQGIVEDAVSTASHITDASRSQDDGKDGVIVTVGVCQVTHTMAVGQVRTDKLAYFV